MSAAMMVVNTADLKGPALDWAAAKAFGQQVEIFTLKFPTGNTHCLGMKPRAVEEGVEWKIWSPQTHRSQAWKLFGAYIQQISADSNGASITTTGGKTFTDENIFTTVCRSFVSHTLGDSVEVPAELLDEVSA